MANDINILRRAVLQSAIASGVLGASASLLAALNRGTDIVLKDGFEDASWLTPAPGTFANISLNTLSDATPPGWPTSDSGAPFQNWSGGVYAADFGIAGGIAIHGSGHLTPGTPIYAGVPVFDLHTRRWTVRARPVSPIFEQPAGSAYYNIYGESIDPATAGHTYAPHTYDGLIYQSSANGGGPEGSLIRHYYAGSSAPTVSRAVHRFDLSSLHNPPTRLFDQLILTGTGNNYPAAALDEGRGGYWFISNNGNGPLAFIRFSDWSQTNYSNAIQYNDYGDHNLTYCRDGSGREFLIAAGRSGPGGVDFTVRICPIVNNLPLGFTLVVPTGTRPGDARSGGVWSTRLNCLVSYEARRSYQVHKLRPPAGALLGAGWAWETRTMTGVAGAVPAHTMVGPSPFSNGAWSRFVEVPERGVFIWCDGLNQPVQAWNVD